MRALLLHLARSRSFDARGQRALDETIHDWDHERDSAPTTPHRWWCDVRSAFALIRAVTLLSWQKPIQADAGRGEGSDESVREEIVSLIRKLSKDSSYDEILRELTAARAAAKPPQPPPPARGGYPRGSIFQHWKVMAGVIILSLVAGTARTYTTPAEYKSSAVVRAEPELVGVTALNAIVRNGQTLLPDTEYFMQAEKAVLGSRDLQRRVVRKLKLTKNPEFNRTESAAAVVVGPPSSPEQAEQLETPAETVAIDAFALRLSIDAQPTAHLFVVSFRSRSSQLSADAANGIATEYVSQNLVRKQKKVVDQLALMGTTLNELTAKIEADQRLFQDQKVKDNLLDPDQVARNVASADGLWRDSRQARQVAEDRYNDLAKLDVEKELPNALNHPDIRANGVVSQLRSQLQQYTIQLTDFVQVQGLAASNAQVIRVKNFIEETTKQIKVEILNQMQTAKNDLERKAAAERNAHIGLDEQKKLQIDNDHTAISYGGLKQSIASQLKIRDSMLEQQKQEQILAKSIENNTRMVEFAQPPGAPYKPDTSRNFVVSLAIGVLLAWVLAFALSRRRPRPPAVPSLV